MGHSPHLTDRAPESKIPSLDETDTDRTPDTTHMDTRYPINLYPKGETMAKERLSIRGYARHRGINHNAVRKAIAAGRITTEPDGRIDPEKADREWASNTDPTRTPNTAPKEGTGSQDRKAGRTIQAARLRKLEAEAEMAEMKTREKAGELILRDEVHGKIFNEVRRLRDAWCNFPARFSAEIAAKLQADHRTVNAILEDYVDRYLVEMADTVGKSLLQEGE